MSPPERTRRPKPERTRPIRGGWLSLFGPPDPASGAAGRSEGQSDAGDGTDPGASRDAGDAISRAVDLGYRVVDDYIRQGQNAARLMARRAYGPQAMANDVQEMTARAVQYGAELMDVWVALLGQAAAGPPNRPDGPDSGASDPEPLRPRGGTPPRPAGRGARLVLAVDSSRPTEVQLDVEDAAGRALEIQDLQYTEGGDVPPLRGATLSGQPPCLRLRIPADQPDGVYAALVLDAGTRSVAGTLVVTVGAPAGDA